MPYASTFHEVFSIYKKDTTVEHMFNNSLHFLTIPACSARHTTRDVNITFLLTSSWKHNTKKKKEEKIYNLALLKKRYAAK